MKKSKEYNFFLIMDGIFIAKCPALQGCYAQGETFEEVIENIKDVIAMCIEERKEEKKKINLK